MVVSPFIPLSSAISTGDCLHRRLWTPTGTGLQPWAPSNRRCSPPLLLPNSLPPPLRAALRSFWRSSATRTGIIQELGVRTRHLFSSSRGQHRHVVMSVRTSACACASQHLDKMCLLCRSRSVACNMQSRERKLPLVFYTQMYKMSSGIRMTPTGSASVSATMMRSPRRRSAAFMPFM